MKAIRLAAIIGWTMLMLSGIGRAEPVDSAEWTVLLYMCGSDLETNAGMASYNLHEIMASPQPTSTMVVDDETHTFAHVPVPSKVNVLVETGGAKRWHNGGEDDPWGLDIASDRLQRYALSHEQNEEGFYPLVLTDEQPLRSMGDPQTLVDFIRWGTERYPAKKVMLVLWDHGSGGLGLTIDEVFGGDMLYLYELGEALEASGVHFEAILMDACLMASLETAQTIAPYADWMIASEELVSGYGTAFRRWFQALFQNPGCDGGNLGSVICDVTEAKYAMMEDEHASLQLTWSVIELSKIERVSEAFDRLFLYLGDMVEYDPAAVANAQQALIEASDRFGTDKDHMYDIGAAMDDGSIVEHIDIRIVNELALAIDDAVLYSVNGMLHADASGLSCCIPVGLTEQQMDIYARSCQSAPILALLDAIHPNWTAPGWVYEKAHRLPEIREIPLYNAVPELVIQDGSARIIGRGDQNLLWQCRYELYRLDEDTGELLRIGTDRAVFKWIDEEGGDYEYSMDCPQKWPSIENHLCCIEYCSEFRRSDYSIGSTDISLYDIPIRIGPDQMNLRIGYWTDEPEEEEPEYQYKVYGLSQGYSETIGAPTRMVKSLALLEGQEYSLLYPVDLAVQRDDRTRYEPGPDLTMYRGLNVKEIPLPVGTYYCDFVLENCFFCQYRTERLEMFWDGRAFTIRAADAE